MAGMPHSHSAMHQSGVVDIPGLVAAQSCGTDCAVAERLNISKKVVPRVIVVQTGTVVLDASSEFLGFQVVAAWSLDSGPPSFPAAHTASYSVLRI